MARRKMPNMAKMGRKLEGLDWGKLADALRTLWHRSYGDGFNEGAEFGILNSVVRARAFLYDKPDATPAEILEYIERMANS